MSADPAWDGAAAAIKLILAVYVLAVGTGTAFMIKDQTALLTRIAGATERTADRTKEADDQLMFVNDSLHQRPFDVTLCRLSPEAQDVFKQALKKGK